MSIKAVAIYHLCEHFLKDPISLRCGCWVCNKHLINKNKTIRCLKCDQKFSTSKRLKSNDVANKILAENLHLNGEKKTS